MRITQIMIDAGERVIMNSEDHHARKLVKQVFEAMWQAAVEAGNPDIHYGPRWMQEAMTVACHSDDDDLDSPTLGS